MWAERAPPTSLLGLKRFFAPPLPLDELPPAAGLPLHWGTFNRAFDAWRQPVQRLLAAGPEMPLLPAPGQRMEVAAGPFNAGWWQQ